MNERILSLKSDLPVVKYFVIDKVSSGISRLILILL